MRIFAVFAVLFLMTACSPVGPSQLTETFDGVLTQGGRATKTFSVHCGGATASCEYSMSVRTLGSGNTLVQLILADASCQQVFNGGLVAASPVGISGTGMASGTYCIALIDVGYLTKSESFSASFTHPK